MQKNGFTLVEILVVLAIIGLVSATLATNIQSVRQQARASSMTQNIKAIEKAFLYKALDENISAWWHEDDFPSSATWAAYIDDLDGEIDEFLPVAPDIPGANWSYTYAYDNDGDELPSTPADCDNPQSLTVQDVRDHLWSGVSISIGIGVPYYNQNFIDIFTQLDESFDGGDGPVCGRIRTAGYAGNQYFNYCPTCIPHGIRYILDGDQSPPH